jgi:hypothetical protein
MPFVRRSIATALKAAPLAALALALFLPTAASPEGQIVIRGADTGSHLTLSMDGDRILVAGFMAAGEPVGCHFSQGRNAAVCPTANVSSIEVAMGPADDKVQVLNRLPLPLTTRLGGGSDKLIANSERDTCYPEGPGAIAASVEAATTSASPASATATASAAAATTTAGTGAAATAASAARATTPA